MVEADLVKKVVPLHESYDDSLGDICQQHQCLQKIVPRKNTH